MISYHEEWRQYDFESIFGLYETVGWSNYTKDKPSLIKAFENSSYVLLALRDKEIVGCLRSMSDDISIHYLQDVLVKPTFQQQGIGRELVKRVLGRFEHVRTHILLTDNQEKQFKFYRSLGYENLKDYKDGQLNSFIKMRKT